MLVVTSLLFAHVARWNHDLLARFNQWLNNTCLRTINFVRNDGLCWRIFKQDVRSLRIMGLPGGRINYCGVNPEHHSPEGKRLEVIGTLVHAYDLRSGAPPCRSTRPYRGDPLSHGAVRLEGQRLMPFIGPLNRMYEVLARKLPMSLHMIQRIHKGMGIPAEVMIGQAEEDLFAA